MVTIIEFFFVKEILDQLNQGRIAKIAQLEEEIKLQESVEPMLKLGKDVFEILRVCIFCATQITVNDLGKLMIIWSQNMNKTITLSEDKQIGKGF